jgi:AraC-like DNA-binding protein
MAQPRATSSEAGGDRSLKHPDAWKPGETIECRPPALKGTLAPSEGEREGVRGLRPLLRSGQPREAGAGGVSLDRCQSLLRRRLTKSLLDMFQRLTGLPLHLRWYQPAEKLSDESLFSLCPHARQKGAGKLAPTCRECLRRRWLPEWANLRPERQFNGLCGLSNSYACLRFQGQPVLTLLVQQPTPASRDARQAFSCAVRLTRLIAHDLSGTLQAERLSVEGRIRPLPPGSAGIPTGAPRGQGAGAPAVELPASAPPLPPANGNHREQLVQRMQDYIHQNYSRPIQLQDLAAALNLNPSYVSYLFSTTLGVTFHHYLEEFRLARAKDLLRDPVRRISDVAFAVGYTNPHYFRYVFTTRLGLPPSAWRQAKAA